MSGTGAPNLVCLALDASGIAATCYLSNPAPGTIALLTSLNGDSYLTFFWEYPSNKCTGFIVANGSRWAPKLLTTTASSAGTVLF